MTITSYMIRKPGRASPIKALSLGKISTAVAIPGGSANHFPGIELPESDKIRDRLVSATLSILLHAGLIGALLLTTLLMPQELEERIFKLTKFEERVVETQPAPAPRVIAESRATFRPAPMAVAPQVPSPAVVQKAVTVINKPKLEMATVAKVQAPKEVERTTQVVEKARAFQSRVQVTASPLEFDTNAPAIKGPKENNEPARTRAGPHQVSVGQSIGTASPKALGDGSSVERGAVSTRDVLGSTDGIRAQVSWAVGDGNLRGSGGKGLGESGISWQDCVGRNAVQGYMQTIKQRVMARWVLPAGAPGNQSVELRFTLDLAGSASSIGVVRAPDPLLGKSALTALRSASPFNQMPKGVRCLAGQPIIATFSNPTIANN